jgi:hypothetical protein
VIDMMRFNVGLCILALGVSLASAGEFVINVSGTTAVTADVAPIRTTHPAGRIIKVLHKGELLTVIRALPNGESLWLETKAMVGNKEQLGYVAKDQTNFDEDLRVGRLLQN